MSMVCTDCGSDMGADPISGAVDGAMRCSQCAVRVVDGERSVVVGSKIMEAAETPWDRQPGETGAAFALFGKFLLMMPEQRNLRELANVTGERLQRLRGLSARWGWADRVRAYDDHWARERRRRRERQLDVALDRQEELATKGLKMLEDALARLDPEEILPGQMPQFAKVFSELRLQALGYREEKDVNLAVEESGQSNKLQVVFVEADTEPGPVGEGVGDERGG